jgi:4-amino-4-deoxy-L-arabinose transferase-like glycosyltransferase
VVVLTTFDDYGITWDEQVQAEYGELVLRYFKSGLQDLSCNNYFNLYLYGPLFDSFCALVYGSTGGAKFAIRHLLIAVCAVATVIAVYKFGRLFSDPWVSVFAALSLMMIPRFYGHAFNNPKDIPFACAFSWAMLAMCHLLIAEHRKWWRFLACGVAIGLALSIRVGAFLLLFYLIAGATLARLTRTGLQWRRLTALDWRMLGIRFAALLSLAWLIMIMFWPWTHHDPLVRPFKAFISITTFSDTYQVLFNGSVYDSNALPKYYLVRYLLITTPPITLFFCICGLLKMVRLSIGRLKSRESFLALMVQLWFFFPLLYVVFKKPNVYDGIRHFLFILPALAIICGYGASWIREAMQGLARNPVLTTLFVVALCFIPVKDLLALHPYQMTYFNILEGGVSQAWREYETDYWTSSYKEAAQWINHQAAKRPDRKTVIVLAANNHNRLCAEYYLGPDIEVHTFFSGAEPIPEEFDYYVATTRYGLHRQFPDLPRAHSIGKGAAVYTVIKTGPARLERIRKNRWPALIAQVSHRYTGSKVPAAFQMAPPQRDGVIELNQRALLNFPEGSDSRGRAHSPVPS